MSGGLTIEGKLPGGVQVDGQTHRDFTLRLPTVRDNVDAIDEVGSNNQLAISAAILARQIVKLGTLEPKQICYELLADMHPSDYNALEAKAIELEKKRMAAAASAPTSSASALPCADPA
jgi:hypothetical protein